MTNGEADMRWEEFAEACPEFADLAGDRFRKDELVMLGTIRRNGWPRISPCEVDVAAGHLFLGMMWRSPKALDLLRDPRVVVHSVTCNREGTDGDIKIYGHARGVPQDDLRSAYRDAIRARIDWAPEEGRYHLFSVDVESGGYIRFTEHTVESWTWDPKRGFRQASRANEP
jgi:hypothetical protein